MTAAGATGLVRDELAAHWEAWSFLASPRDVGCHLYARAYLSPALARGSRPHLGWLAYRNAAVVRELTRERELVRRAVTGDADLRAARRARAVLGGRPR